MPDSTFDSSIPVADLLVTHEDYRPDRIEVYNDLYEGGERFESRKDNYLRYRSIEKSGDTFANKHRKQRLASATYTPHVAGAVDWIVAATFQSEPGILVDAKEGESGDYWNGLNTDADGRGCDFAAIMRERELKALIDGRSYLTARFPKVDLPEKASLARQREAGGLDAVIGTLDAKDVDDWGEDPRGNLEWVRTHIVEPVRVKLWGRPTKERHTWTYITADSLIEYTAERDLDKDGKPKEWGKDAKATTTGPRPHKLGRLPVWPIRIPRGLWLMNRLAHVALSLFNREASHDWALDTSAFAIPVIQSDKKIDNIFASELMALKLGPEDKFGWSIPATQHFDALDKSAERKKANLFLAIQATALVAASKDSNGRQSGVAKFRDFGAIATLLSAYAGSLRDAGESLITTIRDAREEKDRVNVSISGLDKFDVQSLELKLKLGESFLSLAGQYGNQATAIAREWVLLDLSLTMANTAPSDVKASIAKQANELIERLRNGEEIEVQTPKPDPAATPPPPADEARTKKTEEVKPVE